MKRFLTNIALAMALLLGLALVLDRAMTHVFRNGRAVKSQWQHRMHGRHYDAVIIGSSRAWWNIDMNRLDSACGMRTLNLANNHYKTTEILLSLRVFLAQGNTTDRVLLQVDHYNLTADPGEFSSTAYEFLPYLHDSVVEAQLVDGSMEWNALRYLPLWRYVKCNFMWGPEELVATATNYRKPLFDSTGTYFSNPRFYGADHVRFTRTGHRLDANMLAIKDICDQQGIELTCFTSPYLNLGGEPDVLDAPRRVVTEAGLAFHDFSDRLAERRYFNDNSHVSIAGGELLTRLLADEILCP